MHVFHWVRRSYFLSIPRHPINDGVKREVEGVREEFEEVRFRGSWSSLKEVREG